MPCYKLENAAFFKKFIGLFNHSNAYIFPSCLRRINNDCIKCFLIFHLIIETARYNSNIFSFQTIRLYVFPCQHHSPLINICHKQLYIIFLCKRYPHRSVSAAHIKNMPASFYYAVAYKNLCSPVNLFYREYPRASIEFKLIAKKHSSKLILNHPALWLFCEIMLRFFHLFFHY